MRIIRNINLLSIPDTSLLPFFYKKEYISFINEKEGKDIVIFYDEHKNTMPCKIWKNKFLKLIQPVFPPLDIQAKRLSPKKEGVFLAEFIALLKKKKMAHRITQPENFAIFKNTPRYSVSASFGTYFLDLENNTEEELFKNIHPKHRNVIKNAEKNDVIIKYGEECIDDFYLLYKQTMNRSNMYCQDISYFKKCHDAIPENSICGVAYHNNAPQGALFMTYSKYAAFYLYGASAEKIEINGSINYLHWTTIQLLKKKGVKRYDFVGARLSHIAGSKLEGIQQFKRRFGAELEEGFLWKKDLDIFDCMVFDELVRFSYKLKKQSPLLDIIDEEILKSTVIDSEAFTFTNRLKLKIQDRKNKFLKNYKKYKKEIDKDDLIKNLMASGIKRGDTIMLHSSLSKVGNIKEGAKAVIEALLEWIGPEGNLVMPAYSYINSMENTAKEKEYIFDPLTTPSVVGIITEEFRKRPGVKRSYHPTHSVCAYGPQADYITEGHFYAKTNFGPDTPFHRIRELKGKIVGLGIPIGPVTIYHSVEDFFPEDFPGVYLPKPVLFKMLIESKEIIKSIFIHHSLFHSIRIDKNKTIESWLLLHFKEKHIFHQTDFGSGMMWWMDVQQLYDEQIALRKKEISIYKVPKDGKN